MLRRLPLSRLLLLCATVLAVGIGATAIALAIASGPTPPPKPLAQALHDALAAQKPDGVTARIQLTDNLLEGANLASNGGEAGQLSSSPLISGASGRLWVASDGRARLELQSEKGDTQILWNGKTAEMYDASTNTLYRYTPPSGESDEADSQPQSGAKHEPPSVAEIEEHIARASKHADVSGATPSDVAGQAAYTLRVAPRENGGLLAGGEVSWDAVHGNPLRAAIYSTNSSSPAIELAATEISYEQPEASALEFTPPASAKVKDVTLPQAPKEGSPSSSEAGKSHLSTHGKGLESIVLAETPIKAGSKESGLGALEGLQKVDVNGTQASELQTQLGSLLTFERAGVRYLMAGSVTPSAIEAFARGL